MGYNFSSNLANIWRYILMVDSNYKTVQYIKDEIAFEKEETVWNNNHPLNDLITEVAERYAQQFKDRIKELENENS